MAYTETEENLEEWNREQMHICPKGYTWMVADCDFDGVCARAQPTGNSPANLKDQPQR